MTLKEFLDLLQSASIVFAALMAAYGIDAWRREFIGKRKMELAEEVLALVLETREIISYIRSPGSFQGEGESRKADEDETESVRRARNLAFVPIERQNQHLEKLNRLWTLSYRFRAQFGNDASKPIDDLRNTIATIKTSCHILAQFWPARQNTPNASASQKLETLISEREALIWENHGVDGKALDQLAQRVDRAVSSLTQTCRAVLESKSTLYSWINAKLSKL